MSERAPLRVFRLCSGKKLPSFGDEILDVPVLGKALSQWHQDVAAGFGFSIENISTPAQLKYPCIFFEESIFFSKEFFGQALGVAQNSEAPSARLGVAASSFRDRFLLPTSASGERTLNFFALKDARDLATLQTVALQGKIYPHGLSIPRQMVADGFYHFDMCPSFAGEIASPFHLLQINMAANLARTHRIRRLLPLSWQKWLFPYESKLFIWSLKRLNRIGRNCHIHPSAIVEGCTIEDGVTIGANAVLRLTHVGRNSTIEENCVVKYCVLGEGTYISQGNHLHLSMTYPQAYLIHGPYQFSIFGRSTAVMAVINCDYRLDQKNILIETAYGKLDSGQALLGIAYGHSSKVGGGNIIAPGRIVPNDYRCAPPAFIIKDFQI